MANKPFQKFIEQKESGAKKKERIRQEKKKIRKETKAYFDKKKAERRGGPIPVASQESGVRSREFPVRRENQDLRSERSGNRNKEDRGAVGPVIQKKDGPKQTPSPAKGLPTAGQASPSRGRIAEGNVNSKPAATNQPANLKPQNPNKPDAGQMPLNKFIAHAGICARRDAADLVKAGKVTVNGQKIIEPGFKVTNNDDIKVQGKKITARKILFTYY
jgi:23S rRNA pseudouridine2605 synthase